MMPQIDTTAILLVAGFIAGIFAGIWYNFSATQHERKVFRIFVFIAIALAIIITIAQKVTGG
jgi:predicted membrane channel-forming protein YqfA (hemolysin III family)